MTRALIVAVAVALIPAPAIASTWPDGPLVDLPELDAARQVSRSYWAAVPDVPTLDAACQGLYPDIRWINFDPANFAGWGRRCTAAGGIWIEQAWLATVNVAYRPVVLCDLLVHELGHALDVGATGNEDDHAYTGDPLDVMTGPVHVPACDALRPAETLPPALTVRDARAAVRAIRPRARLRVAMTEFDARGVAAVTVQARARSRRSRWRTYRVLPGPTIATRPAG